MFFQKAVLQFRQHERGVRKLTIKTILELREAVKRKVERLALSDDERFVQIEMRERGQGEVHLLSHLDREQEGDFGGRRSPAYSGVYLDTGFNQPHSENADWTMSYYLKKDHVALYVYWQSNGMVSRPSQKFTNLVEVSIESLTDEQLVQLAGKLLNL